MIRAIFAAAILLVGVRIVLDPSPLVPLLTGLSDSIQEFSQSLSWSRGPGAPVDAASAARFLRFAGAFASAVALAQLVTLL